jgi:hypothetical protein
LRNVVKSEILFAPSSYRHEAERCVRPVLFLS